MRNSLLAGGIVAVAAALAVVLGVLFGLELDSFALIGVAMGAVVALIPDSRPGFRLTGFAAGVVVTFLGYVARAAVLPDTANGRAVAAFLMLGLCVAVAAVSFGRLPLWTTLVGSATFFGAYEATFAAAPPEVASTSLTALTAVAFTAALGFLAASFVAPLPSAKLASHCAATNDQEPEPELAALDASLDEMMEPAK